MEKAVWNVLFNKADDICQPRDLSDTVFAASVGAALVTENGNIYKGVNLDTACSIGFCAERNAIGSMVTAGESQISKLVAVRSGQVILPCSVCRELLMQLDERNKDMEVLVKLEGYETKRLSQLLPDYWR